MWLQCRMPGSIRPFYVLEDLFSFHYFPLDHEFFDQLFFCCLDGQQRGDPVEQLLFGRA
jgi:hypothetical protein